MDIYIQSQIGQCSDFKVSAKAENETVSIVISPLKIDNPDGSNIKVVSGCNMWQACFNERCHFSAGARKLPKIERAGKKPAQV